MKPIKTTEKCPFLQNQMIKGTLLTLQPSDKMNVLLTSLKLSVIFCPGKPFISRM